MVSMVIELLRTVSEVFLGVWCKTMQHNVV